jgi:hypothetical protein
LRSRELLTVSPIIISSGVGQLRPSVVVHVDIGSGCGEAASSATQSARSTAVLSGKDRVGVLREFRGVKVGDTASSSIWVAHLTLCSRERDEVNWIVDRSSG